MNLDDASSQYRFLKGLGALGQLIFEHDWTHSPLGAPGDWPPSLKMAVSLMLNSRQPMWLGWGRECLFLYNDACSALLSPAKHPCALGRPAAQVWPEIWEHGTALVERVFADGEATLADDMRLFLSRAEGLEEHYFSLSYSPIRDEAGVVVGLLASNTDLTARHLDGRRLRTLSALAAGALLEKTTSAVCTTAASIIADNRADIPFALLYLSDADQRRATLEQRIHLPSLPGLAPHTVTLHGPDQGDSAWPIARVLTSQHTELVSLPELLSPADLAALPSGLAAQPVRQALVLPLTTPGQAQALGVLICGINPTRAPDHDYRNFFALLATQITTALQNAQACEADQRRADLLLEQDQAKTTFFSNVSHEFRAPLTLMLGPLQEMLSDTCHPLPEVQRQRGHMLQRNAMRLQRLVNALLEFSRAQADSARAAYQRVDLAALTADLASSFRSTIEGAGLLFEVNCPPLQEETYVDVAMWEKIVLNLLSNAFKFTFDGKISLTLSGHGEQVSLTVRDTGVGIAAEQLPLVFKRFHRIEGSLARTHEGSGIGLALVRDLVNLLGGSIHVDSAVQQGSSFTLMLPAGRAHLPVDQVTAISVPQPLDQLQADAFAEEASRWLPVPADQRKPDLPQIATGSSVRILIVDDNADMRDYLHKLLSSHWHIDTAANGQSALEAAQQDLPDLIVSDVMMPQLNGFALLARLRADERTRHIPFLMLSARSGEEAWLEGLAAGADDYMVKPFSSRELIVRIESLLLRAQIRALEKRHTDRMSTIFAQAPVAIAITRGPNHVFELVNPPYCELIGNRPIIGRSVRESLPELDGQEMLNLLDEVYRRAEPYIGRSLGVMLRRSAQGAVEERFFDFVYQPMFKPDGAIEGIAMVAFEVTELTRARRAAEVANRTKDEFLAMLGHELRNPLTPILTAVHLMRMRGGAGVEKESRVIERQARHLVRLVDDLLDVSRVAQGKVNLQKKKLEVAEVITKAIETVSPLLEERQHQLLENVPTQGLLVHADPERLTQVIANLLTNAGKYTENRGEIRIDARLDNDHIVIDVRDNGIGIKANMLPHVFDMFAQESQALDRAGGGLGLGLAIVRSLTELHGGSVHVFSAGVGTGTVFTVKLPAVLSDSSALSSPLPLNDSTSDGIPIEACNVLVVDDNQDAAQILAELLSMQGHQVQVAFDGPTALEIVNHFTPQVALLDIGLPIMDGYEVAQHLREMPHLQGLHLIALTGYGQPGDKLRSAQAGFDHHLVKPVDIDVVEQLIRRTMESSAIPTPAQAGAEWDRIRKANF